MGDLATDTAIAACADGRFTANLSRDWEIWGPQGGYLASFALRAAGAHCGLARPASIVGHFLGVASFDAPIDITCTTLRAARAAHSVRVSITQGDRAISEAMVWGIVADLPALAHHDAPRPDTPSCQELPTIEERLAAIGADVETRFAFWENFEQRPVAFSETWMERATGAYPPEWMQWLRYTPTAAYADPWIDACRLLVLVDVGSWPAASSYHNQAELYAPSIDLACELHRIRSDAEWLFVHAHSACAADGLVASHQRVWADDGTLLASGTSQLLCRPVRG